MNADMSSTSIEEDSCCPLPPRMSFQRNTDTNSSTTLLTTPTLPSKSPLITSTRSSTQNSSASVFSDFKAKHCTSLSRDVAQNCNSERLGVAIPKLSGLRGTSRFRRLLLKTLRQNTHP